MTNKEIKTKLTQVINNEGKKDKETIAHIAGYATGDEAVVSAQGDVKAILFELAQDNDNYIAMLTACINCAFSDATKLKIFCEAVKQANEFARKRVSK